MALFQLAYNKTMANEGGYSNHPSDKGKETYRGISRVHHPNWSGWAKIDELKLTSTLGPATVFAQLEPEVMAFYESTFWNNIHGSCIPDQGLANMLFDASVLCGDVFAVKTWQDTLDRVITDTEIDGRWGKLTEAATLQACHSQFFGPAKDLFKYGWMCHLVNIVRHKSDQKVFLYGWITRVLGHC